MKRFSRTVATLAAMALVASALTTHAAAAEAAKEAPKERPKNRVVAIYFHRTERCPTCQKMGDYTEEAVKKGFEEQLKAGAVEFHYIDFQDKKNAAFAKAYKVTGPALILVRVVDKKVVEFLNLKDIWSHVGDKKAFVKYVQDHITAYLGKKK